MMFRFRAEERGQVAVITAFVMVGLLVAAGLAIDGGMALRDRRQMQNAADASALAGTRKLAAAIFSSDTVTDTHVYDAVVDYASRNGVEDPSDVVADYVDVDMTGGDHQFLGHVGGGSIPPDTSGISTTTTIARSTSLVSVIGFNQARASAHAVALVGPPPSGGGLRPFGLPEELFGQYDDPYERDDGTPREYMIDFSNCSNPGPTNCGVWENTTTGGPVLLAQHRGWLNLGFMWNADEASEFPRATYEDECSDGNDGTNQNEMKCWMENGSNALVYPDDYIHGWPGTGTPGVGIADELLKDDPATPECDEPILVPIYEYDEDEENTSAYAWEEIPLEADEKPAEGVEQGGGYYYHVTGLASVCIEEADQGSKEIYFRLLDEAYSITGENASLNEELGFGGEYGSNSFTVRLWD